MSEETVYVTAAKKEKHGMRGYQADQTQFLWSASPQHIVTFFGWCASGYAVGSTQGRKSALRADKFTQESYNEKLA